MDRGPRSNCPVHLALDAIGDRWNLLILRDVMMRRKSRYQEFLRSEEGISTNILADRLLRLEGLGLISKSADPDDRRQFRYEPTQKALDLLPVIFEMARWSLKYNPYVGSDHPFIRRLQAGKEVFIRQTLAQFKAAPRGAPRQPAVRGPAGRAGPRAQS